MNLGAQPPSLTSDLDFWEVVLKDGRTVFIRAHGVAERDDFYCFVALVVGNPPYECELARFPVASVESLEGGWPTPREADDALGDSESP